MAGKLSDDALLKLVGPACRKIALPWQHPAEFGTTEWRTVARALCVSEYEALSRTVERDDCDFTRLGTHPLIANEPPPPDEQKPPVPIRDLFRGYVAARQFERRQRDGGKWQEPVIDSLIKFVKHDDARCLAWADISEWRDHLLKIPLSAKTVSDIYLSAVKSLLEWARGKRPA